LLDQVWAEEGTFTDPTAHVAGSVFVEGTDFGELSPDGKLHRIVGFFGPLAFKP
jgi:hypothetical protein